MIDSTLVITELELRVTQLEGSVHRLRDERDLLRLALEDLRHQLDSASERIHDLQILNGRLQSRIDNGIEL